MADDNEILIKIGADISGLRSQAEAGAAAVESFSARASDALQAYIGNIQQIPAAQATIKQSVADAQAQVETASSAMSEAELAFGKAAAQGSEQAISVLQQYRAELEGAEAQLAALEAAQRSAVSSLVRPQATPSQAASFREYLAASSQRTGIVAAPPAREAVAGPAEAVSPTAPAEVVPVAAGAAAGEEAAVEDKTADASATKELTTANQQLAASYEEVGTAAAASFESIGLVGSTAAKSADIAAGLERTTTAQNAYNQAARRGGEAAAQLGRAFDEAIAGGAGITEAMEAAVRASGQAGEAFSAEAAQSDILVAAQRQMAEATLEAAAARKILNDTIKENVGRTDAGAVSAVAGAQVADFAAIEQLAAAKQNLGEVEEYVAATGTRETEVLAGNTAAEERNATITEQGAAAQEALAAAQSAGASTAEAEATEESIVTGATAAAAGSVNELTASEARGVGGAVAMSGALRGLQGNMYGLDRLAAQYAVTSLGLGKILEAAFPVIGAVALLGVVGSLGEELYDTYTKGQEAAQAIANEFDVANQKLEATRDDIELVNSKLQDQIDKLEGHPNNGLQTALLEAIAAADKLQQKLEADNEALEGLLKKKEVSFWTGLVTNQAPTGGLDQQIQDESQKFTDAAAKATLEYDKAMRAAGGDKDKAAAAVKARSEAMNAAFDQEISALQAKLDKENDVVREAQERDQDLIAHPLLYGEQAAETPAAPDNSAARKTLEGQIQRLQTQKEIAALEENTEPLQAQQKKLEQQKQFASEANQASEEYLRGLERMLTQEELLHGKSNMLEAAFWHEHVNDAQLGVNQVEAVEQKILHAEEGLGHEQPESPLDRLIKKTAKDAKESADSLQHEIDRMLEAGQRLQELVLVKPQAEHQQAAAQSTHEQEIGAIEESHERAQLPGSPSQATMQKQMDELRAYHLAIEQENERFEIEQLANTPGNDAAQVAQLEHLEDQLVEAQRSGDDKRITEAQQALQKQVAIMAQANTQESAQMRTLQNNLTEDVVKGNMQRLQDTEKSLQQQLQKFEQVYNAITNDLNQAINKMISTTEKPSKIFAQMFNQILVQLATFAEKWLEQQALMWAKTEILALLGKTQQAAATAAANTATVVSDAGVAAANTMAYYTAVDPPAAPALAAAAYAATIAFGSTAAFEHGGIVSGMSGMPVPIVAHAGERVLSAMQTQNFERMVNDPASGGSGHSTFNLNYNGQVNAFDRNGMRSTLRAHSEDIVDIIREAWNKGKLR